MALPTHDDVAPRARRLTSPTADAATVPRGTTSPRSMTPDLGFVHRWEPPAHEGAPVLLLLHGTGGNEDDLLPLGRLLVPGAGLLSPRGPVSEHGAPRFFRRLAEGVFDVPDLIARAGDLARFVERAADAYGFARGSAVAVGYSNGANIASATMLLHPGTLRGAVLFRGMVPLQPERVPDLGGAPVLLSNGRMDPMVPAAQVSQLEELLRRANANVTVHWQRSGHELTNEAVSWARDWMEETLLPRSAAPDDHA